MKMVWHCDSAREQHQQRTTAALPDWASFCTINHFLSAWNYVKIGKESVTMWWKTEIPMQLHDLECATVCYHHCG